MPFKVALSPLVVALLDEGGLGDSQIGKVATIYPPDDEAFAALVADLRGHEEIVGPPVPDDVWLGGPVFARYGAFDGIVGQDLLGNATLAGLPGATVVLGAAAGSVLLSGIMARRGRRLGLTLGYLVSVIGAVIATLAVISSGRMSFAPKRIAVWLPSQPPAIAPTAMHSPSSPLSLSRLPQHRAR